MTRPNVDEILISAVLPVYNEAGVLDELLCRVRDAIGQTGAAGEIVFVDDGSSDGSGEKLDQLAGECSQVRVLHLSRNFGHQAAVQAGLAHAQGDVVLLMDSDMQDAPEALARFLLQWQAGYDVVSFGNGLEAYERLKEEPFTLLLTDIVMPEMDGIELARKASELDPELKIMFITGFAAVALNPDSHAPKDAKILSKPFHLRDLVDQVERLLAA